MSVNKYNGTNLIRVAGKGKKGDAPDVMIGATATTDGAIGSVPQAMAGDENKVLKGNGSWGEAAADDNFVGTLAQWNALSVAEQIKYKTADIIDDFNGAPVDSALSDTSTNPVQNKVVKAAFDSRDNELAKRVISQIRTVSTGAHTISNVSQGDVFMFVRNAYGVVAISETSTVEIVVELSSITDVSLNDGVLSFTRTSQYTGGVICLTHNNVTVN